MAVATVTFNPNAQLPVLGGAGDPGLRTVAYYGTVSVTPSPATYATGGLVSAQAAITGGNTLATNPGGLAAPNSPAPFADRTPVGAWIYSVTASGFLYGWNTSTKKLQIFAANPGGAQGTGPVFVEMTNGTAIPAAVSGDVIFYNFIFPRV